MDHSSSSEEEEDTTAVATSNLVRSLVKGETSASGKKAFIRNAKITTDTEFLSTNIRQPDMGENDEIITTDDYNPNETTAVKKKKVDNNEEDEEIRIAMNMALAIKNNPNLTAEEIRRLVGETQKEQQQNIAVAVANKKEKEKEQLQQHIKEQLLIPGRLANSFLGIKEDNNNNASLPTSLENNFLSAVESLHKIVGAGPTITTPDKEDNAPPIVESPVSSVKLGIVDEKATQPKEEEPEKDDKNPEGTMLQDTTAAAVDEEGLVHLSASVWKRRSGFAKYSQKAWERRRIILKEGVLQYFKDDSLLDNAEEESLLSADHDHIDSKDSTDTINSKNPNWLAVNMEKAKASVEKNIEKAKANMEKNMEKAKANMDKFVSDMALPFSIEDDPNTPRGVLDIVKESATVGAAMGHSGSPTPYCLSIKVGSETKWKLCFDTHELQMQWLAALTDIIVKSSVEGYNNNIDNLTKSEDNNWTEGSSTFNIRPTTGESWKLDDYHIASIYAAGKNNQSKEEEANADNNAEIGDDDDAAEEVKVSNREMFLETQSYYDRQIDDEDDRGETSKVYYKLSEKRLFAAAAILNTALILVQFSSPTSNRFWQLASVANVGLYLLLSKQGEQKSQRKMSKANSSIKDDILSKQRSIQAPMPGKTEISAKTTTGEIKKVGKQTANFKPQAGSTSMKVDDPESSPMNSNNIRFVGWRCRESLQVRSHNYLSTKKKVPSFGTLYETVAVDLLDCKNRIPDMSSRVTLPKVNFQTKEPKRWHAPDIFVVTISLPTDAPSAFGGTKIDGGCYTITVYFRMREETRRILERITDDGYDPSAEKDVESSNVNATRLFDRWCGKASKDDKLMSRFKLIFFGDNFEDIGIPSYIRAYNGKPVLIKRPGQTGFLYDHRSEQNSMEFEISLHPFPYLAKQAFCYLVDNYFSQLVLSVGFLIESRSEDELPECVIGSAQLCHPDPSSSIRANNFFDGTSPKSHE